jgi:hypothetical protein
MNRDAEDRVFKTTLEPPADEEPAPAEPPGSSAPAH